MLRCWQKRLLNNREFARYDFDTKGSHTLDIKAGSYYVWLVGGGGGGAMLDNYVSTRTYAKGGVGGTICAKINIPRDTTITINVGAGGNTTAKTYTQAGVVAQGGNGEQTSISGLEGVTIYAGGGTGAKVESTGLATANSYVGVQGSNYATGRNVLEILEDNVNQIISTKGQQSQSVVRSMFPRYQANTNWAEDTNKGAGGACGWENESTYVLLSGFRGFVRIETAY